MKKKSLTDKIIKNIKNTVKRTLISSATNAVVDGIVKSATGGKTSKKSKK